LSPQKQAILAYANLKMQSNDFSSYLQENKLLQTYGGLGNPRQHSDGEIKTNWQNAIKRSVNQKSNHAFFGLAPISTIPGIPNVLRDGGAFDLRVQQKKTLI
jgi:hypothetical protein